MISREDIKKLAELARIHLTEKEEKNLEKDLQSILSYVEKLKEVDVSGIPEMTHAVEAKNVFRNDEAGEIGENDKPVLLTEQFPEVVKYIKEYVKGHSFILDSEAVGYDKKTKQYKPFQAISQRI
ncbi:MAG: Asp-tRNA(Asn)/Glu-tRNA(Gln) amidotransferase subunit GatC, partial [Patescibacteria group bacterium]